MKSKFLWMATCLSALFVSCERDVLYDDGFDEAVMVAPSSVKLVKSEVLRYELPELYFLWENELASISQSVSMKYVEWYATCTPFRAEDFSLYDDWTWRASERVGDTLNVYLITSSSSTNVTLSYEYYTVGNELILTAKKREWKDALEGQMVCYTGRKLQFVPVKKRR